MQLKVLKAPLSFNVPHLFVSSGVPTAVVVTKDEDTERKERQVVRDNFLELKDVRVKAEGAPPKQKETRVTLSRQFTHQGYCEELKALRPTEQSNTKHLQWTDPPTGSPGNGETMEVPPCSEDVTPNRGPPLGSQPGTRRAERRLQKCEAFKAHLQKPLERASHGNEGLGRERGRSAAGNGCPGAGEGPPCC